jgi:hypothetical protein
VSDQQRLLRGVPSCDTIWATLRAVPINAPMIDHGMNEMMVLERVAEITRFLLLQTEFMVSPGGGLRAWLRMNMILAMVLIIPAVLVVPVVTSLAGSFATMTMFLYQASVNLFYTVVTLIGTVASVLAFISVLKCFGWEMVDVVRGGVDIIFSCGRPPQSRGEIWRANHLDVDAEGRAESPLQFFSTRTRS